MDDIPKRTVGPDAESGDDPLKTERIASVAIPHGEKPGELDPTGAEAIEPAVEKGGDAADAQVDPAGLDLDAAGVEPAESRAEDDETARAQDTVRIAPGSADAVAAEDAAGAERRPSWKRPRTIGLALVALVLIGVVGLAAAQASGLVSIVPADLLQTTGQSSAPASGDDGRGAGDESKQEALRAEEDASGEAETEETGLDAPPDDEPPVADGADSPSGGSVDGSDSGASAPAAAPAPEPDPAPAPAPEPAPAPAPATITVSVYVDSSRAASYGYSSCLASASVTVPQGATVYDALAATGVSVGGSSSYVSSIGGLAEFSCGANSGWLYYVNGYSPGYGPGSYALSGGESITWVYTLDLGADV